MATMVKAKSVFTSKTVWFNVLFVLGLVLTALVDSDLIKHNPEIVYWVGLVNAVVNMILRRFSNQPMTLRGNEIKEVKDK